MANNAAHPPVNGNPNPGPEDPAKKELKLEEGTIIKNRWKITGKIGQGAFGETYSGYDLNGTESDQVAIKVERWDNKKMVLKLEVMALKKLQSSPHVVKYVSSGRQDDFNFLVMERLGDNIAELRKRSPNGNLTMTSTLLLGVQMIDAIEGCHNLCYIHRDVKPSNFVMGRDATRRNCYLIDFGLARKYRMPNGEIRPPRKTAGFRGTARYASINSHQSKELGRRDDLWSLFYVLVEFGRNTLPWRKIKDKDQIGEMKEKYTNPELVKDLPRGFLLFMEHLQGLSYASQPDYQYLRGLLTDIMRDEGITDRDPFDWELDEPRNTMTASAMSATRASQSRTRPNAPPVVSRPVGNASNVVSPRSSPRNPQNDQESIDANSQGAGSEELQDAQQRPRLSVPGARPASPLKAEADLRPGDSVLRAGATVARAGQPAASHHHPQPDPFVVYDTTPQRIPADQRRATPAERPGPANIDAPFRQPTPTLANAPQVDNRDSPLSSMNKMPPTPQTTAVVQRVEEREKKGCKCVVM